VPARGGLREGKRKDFFDLQIPPRRRPTKEVWCKEEGSADAMSY